MGKKLVWVLGIAIVLSLILSINVSAYPYGIYADGTGNNNYRNTMIGFDWDGTIVTSIANVQCSTPTTAKPTFKILETRHGTDQFYAGDRGGCDGRPRYIDGSVVKAEDIKAAYGSYINKANPKCIHYSNIEAWTEGEDHQVNPHYTLGGYMYVNQRTTMPFTLAVMAEAGDVDQSTYVAIFNIDQNNPQNILGAVDLDTTKDYDYLFMSVDGGWCTHTSTFTGLDPGIYYMMININLDNDANDGDTADIGSNIIFYGSGSPSNWENADTGLRNSQYTIYSDPLTADQIVALYPDSVIDTAFCVAAGGDKNSNISLNAGCCRAKYEGAVWGGYLCDGTQWVETSPEQYCAMLSGGNYGFEPYILDKFRGSIQPLEYIYSATDASDGCCGDDGLRDYDYIITADGVKQWLCYDYKLPKKSGDQPDNTWLNAMTHPFTIVTVNEKVLSLNPRKLNTTNDVVSNSQDWYYCNADGSSNLKGTPISDGGTFAPRFEDEQYSCAAMMSNVFNDLFEEACYIDGGNGQFREAESWDSGPFRQSCCMRVDTPTGKEVAKASDVTNCQRCYITAEIDPVTPEKIVSLTTPESTFDSDDWGVIDKDVCVNDPASCLKGTINYDPTKSCAQQQVEPDLNKTLCDMSTSYCTGGSPFITTDNRTNPNARCCIGSQPKCIDKTNITDVSSCNLAGGKDFAAPQSCLGVAIPLGQGKQCCIGIPYMDYKSNANYVQAAPESFICFKETGDNIISQCCYDSTCANVDYASGSMISSYNRRVLTRGSSIHTLENYDIFDKTQNSLIKDRAYKFKIRGGTGITDGQTIATAKKSTDGFSYIEFDVLTDSETMDVYVNDKLVGKLFKYSVNGNKSGIWHHITIPLSDIGFITQLYNIKFADTSAGIHYVIADNIALVPSDFSTINTKNNYCTGGFEGWVEDLDAPEGSAEFQEYGPHMFACSGIASYSWTGTQCCGDDTKYYNFGEHYADTLFGCFDGTKVRNDQTVPEAKAYYSSSNLLTDDLSIAEYNDLLYFNSSYFGCQVPDGKYLADELSKSLDGSESGVPLYYAGNNIKEQCGMAGSHYCMNGVWRKKIITADGTDREFPGSQIELKKIPAGAELIKNGFWS